MSLLRFVVRRSGEIVITLFIIATLTFVMFRLMPSDPAGMMLNPYRTPEMVEWHKRLWGLDKSYAEQYFLFLRNMLQGEFGKSFFSDQDVYEILADRLPATLLLFTTMTVVSFSLGMHLGRFVAWRRGSRLEYGSTVFGVFMFSMPIFWIALLCMWVFSFRLGLFPLGGMKTPELWDAAANTSLLVKILDIGHHLFLPLTVGVLTFAPAIMLMMRNVMVETFGEEYITTARAKGLSEGDVRDHHASRNVMLPMVTALTLSVAGSFMGSVVMEVIFSWPGVGAKFLEAAVNYDYPVVQGAFIIMGAVLLISILVADILCAYLDPRVRLR